MTPNEPVMCPYCPAGVPMVMAMSRTHMRCPRCASTSPVVNNLHTAVTEPEEIVLEMARRRYVPNNTKDNGGRTE